MYVCVYLGVAACGSVCVYVCIVVAWVVLCCGDGCGGGGCGDGVGLMVWVVLMAVGVVEVGVVVRVEGGWRGVRTQRRQEYTSTCVHSISIPTYISHMYS